MTRSKWQHFQIVGVQKRKFADPELKLATPHIIKLDIYPKEEEAYSYPYLHSWVVADAVNILSEYSNSIKTEPLIPAGAPLDFVPTARMTGISSQK